jgi:hypothetical protein
LCEYHIFGSPLFIKDMSRISLTIIRWRLQFVGKWRNRRCPPPQKMPQPITLLPGHYSSWMWRKFL